MKIRIGRELLAQLAIVKSNGFGITEAVERAARRWERMGKPDLTNEAPGSTYGGTVATVEAAAGMDAPTVRRLLAWYFRNWPAKPPRSKFQTKLKAGRDYIIEPLRDRDDEEDEDEEDEDEEEEEVCAAPRKKAKKSRPAGAAKGETTADGD